MSVAVRLGWSLRPVPPLSRKPSFGRKPRREQLATWNGRRVSFAVSSAVVLTSPPAPVRWALIDIGLQLVGFLIVPVGRSSA